MIKYVAIEAERARRGMSKKDLAAQLGVSYDTVKNWISGKTQLPGDALLKLAELFDTSTDYLLGRRDAS